MERKKFLNLDVPSSLILVFFLLFIISISIFSMGTRYQAYVAAENEAKSNTEKVYNQLLGSYTSYLDQIDQYLMFENQTISQDIFVELVHEIVADDPLIDAVFLAPSGYVEYVFPPSELNSYEGIDMLEDNTTTNFDELMDTVTSDEYAVLLSTSDVVEDIQFVKAVTVDTAFYGFVVIDINYEEFVLAVKALEDEGLKTVLLQDNQYVIGYETYNVNDYKRVDVGENDFDLSLHFQIQNSYRTAFHRGVFLELFIIFVFATVILIMLYREHEKNMSILQTLKHRQSHDIITELPNLQQMYVDVNHLINTNREFYIAFGRLNNFKTINDQFGQQIGNAVLEKFSVLVNQVLQSNTILYSYGGEEYSLVIETNNKDEARNIIKRVLKILENDVVIDKIRANLSMNVGIVKYPDNGFTMEQLIHNANITVAEIPSYEFNTYRFYSRELVKSVLSIQDFDKMMLSMPLHSFETYIMPVIRTKDDTIVGFECLSRAFDEFGNAMPIGEIVDSFERNGRIQELDLVVFKNMITILQRLNNEFDNEYFISLNVSALSFNTDYVNQVISLYRDANIQKGTIVLELTESYRVDDYDYLLKLFNRLHKEGIRIGVDDFGSGYSSINYISRFPLYMLKVDKRYVRDFKANEFNKTMMQTLISIADVIGCLLVAEGVDTPDTLEFLQEHNCPYYQGFLFSKGLPVDEAIELARKNNRKVKKD